MKTITATLAALLLTGAATAALAQDRDHDRADRGQGRPAPAASPAPAPAPAPQAQPRGPQEGHARFGAPAGPQAGPARNFERHDGQGHDAQAQRFQGGAPAPGPQRFQGGAPAPAPAPQRFDRGGPAAPGGPRQFDRERGPREVIPPAGGVDARQFERRDGRDAGRDWRDGRRDGDHRDGTNPWRRGDRWQAGRSPPVFWSHDRFRVGRYRAPYGFYARAWGFGEFLPQGWYGQDYWIGDFLDYGLPYPPPGYEWVRVGDDALMIDRFTGRIVQVVRGIFW